MLIDVADQIAGLVEAGELNRRRDAQPATELRSRAPSLRISRTSRSCIARQQRLPSEETKSSF
jgi:hypothetical protein